MLRVVALNVDMGRCIYCHSVVTRNEDSCYVCGDTFPKEKKLVVPYRPVSAFSNTVFLVSLAFTAYRFFGQHKLSLSLTLAISCSLLLVKIVAERFAARKSN